MGSTMFFGLLGPVEARVDDREVRLGGPRARAVLAALLLDANRVVPLASIVQTAWGDEASGAARFQVQNRMSALRRALRQSGGEDLIETAGAGYVIHVQPGQLDAQLFDTQLDEARRSIAAGDLTSAARTLTDALRLWRGPALHGLETPQLRVAARCLDEARLTARELLVDLDLRLGRHHEVIGELLDFVTAHPWREGAAGKLMLALYRAGRRREALEAYERTHHLLRSELGIDPGDDLVRLRDQILRDDPRLSYSIPDGAAEPAAAVGTASGPSVAGQFAGSPTGVVDTAIQQDRDGAEPGTDLNGVDLVPRQLPMVTRHFVGRADELARLDRLAAPTGSATVTLLMVGMAGVGKTALAVYWAHRIAGQFHDGQLYVNLRGFDPARTPMAPAEAIRGFLDALAIPPGRIPANLDAQAALYRSLLAGRRMLVVLDNAGHADQVRPLLPGSPTCFVVVTSRNRLAGLAAIEDVQAITLDLLPAAEAEELLSQRLGPDRVGAEPQVTSEIIARCGRLPLALAIVAAVAAAHRSFPLTALAKELREVRGRLDAFAGDDSAVDLRAVFSWSYNALGTHAARLFRLLGLHPGPEISVPAAASLADVPVSELRPVLAELTRAHLIVERGPGRYTLHDLLRAYAAEQAHRLESDEQRNAAIHRALDHYLHTAHAAARLLDPHRDQISPTPLQPGARPENLADHQRALHWLSTEVPVLLSVVDQAASIGSDTHTWQLAWTLATYLYRRGYWHDLTIPYAALAAARRLADPTAQSHAHRLLALAQLRIGRLDDAHTQLRQALDLSTEADDPAGQAHCHNSLAALRERQGHHVEALDHARRALDLYRVAGHRRGQAAALNGIGWYHALLGDHQRALNYCQQALTVLQELDDHPGQAATWDSLAYAHHQLGQYTQAITCYQHAVDLFRDLADRHELADTLVHLGDSHYAAGNPRAAGTAWRDALTILNDIDHPDANQVHTKLQQLALACHAGVPSSR